MCRGRRLHPRKQCADRYAGADRRADAYSYSDPDDYAFAWTHSYGNGDSDTFGYSHGDIHGNARADIDCNSDGNADDRAACDCEANTDADSGDVFKRCRRSLSDCGFGAG